MHHLMMRRTGKEVPSPSQEMGVLLILVSLIKIFKNTPIIFLPALDDIAFPGCLVVTYRPNNRKVAPDKH